MEGVVPLGDFWLMLKLLSMLSDEELLKAPMREEVLTAAVTLWRMRSNEVIFKSTEAVKSVQIMLKGDKIDRNMLRDISWLNFMSRGDEYIDFLEFRNDKLRLAKEALKPKEEEEKVVKPVEETEGGDDDKKKGKRGGKANFGGISLEMFR